MNFNIFIQKYPTIIEIYDKMPKILTWLESFNIPAKKSRFGQYQRLLNNFLSYNFDEQLG